MTILLEAIFTDLILWLLSGTFNVSAIGTVEAAEVDVLVVGGGGGGGGCL